MSTPESPQPGPCTPWISAEDVAAVCSSVDATDPSVYEAAALQASEVLYELSGRQFTGLCGPVTVRPCSGACTCWIPRRIDGGGRCGWLNRVKLWPPVREVLEVLIDGVVVDPAEYRVDGRKYLTRLDDPANGRPRRWPACQHLGRSETEEGTFAVLFTFGMDPPQAGLNAAADLACEIAPALSGDAECSLPAGTVRISRQGVEIDLASLHARRTGLASVDSFLITYNPDGLRRKPAVFSPDIEPFAPKVG